MEKSLYLHKILNRCERQKKLRKIYFYSVLFMVFVLVNVLFLPIYSNVFNFVFNSIDENINQVELDYTYQEELINDDYSIKYEEIDNFYIDSDEYKTFFENYVCDENFTCRPIESLTDEFEGSATFYEEEQSETYYSVIDVIEAVINGVVDNVISFFENNPFILYLIFLVSLFSLPSIIRFLFDIY